MPLPAYTKGQVFWGTFLGGPVAGLYFVKKNFDLMGDTVAAAKCMKYGIIGIAILAMLLPILPDTPPRILYGLAYAFGAQYVYVEKQSATLQDYPPHPNKAVAKTALLCFLAFGALFIPVFCLYIYLGLLGGH